MGRQTVRRIPLRCLCGNPDTRTEKSSMTTQLPDVDRILDAASHFIVANGFEQISMESIARNAGIPLDDLQRTFLTLDDVLVSMLNREYASMYAVIVDNVERDPRGGLLSRIYLYTLSAVYERPLAKALYTTDPRALGAIMRNSHGFTYIPTLGMRSTFIEAMQRAGIVRRDVDARAVSQVLSTFSAGLALTAPHDDLDFVIRGVSDLLARAVDADVTDTSAGKAAFFDYATSLTAGG
jgi:AcrR family transcriptional regulator